MDEVLARAITRPTPPIASIDPSLDLQLALLVDKALAYEKSQRFADAGEMQSELRVLYHRLAGGAEPRAVQPSFADGAMATSVSAGEVFDPASVPWKNQPTAGESDPLRAGSNATLTTARGVAMTGSANFAPSMKRWVPLAVAGTAVSLIGFALHVRRGTSADPPTAAVAPSNSTSPRTSPAASPVVVPAGPVAPTTATAGHVGSLAVLGTAQPSAVENISSSGDAGSEVVALSFIPISATDDPKAAKPELCLIERRGEKLEKLATGSLLIGDTECNNLPAAGSDPPSFELDHAQYSLASDTTALGVRLSCQNTFGSGEGGQSRLYLLEQRGKKLAQAFDQEIGWFSHDRVASSQAEAKGIVVIQKKEHDGHFDLAIHHHPRV